MDELSLYILDIAMNSLRAGASEISLTITEDDEAVCFCIKDNGCGMSKDQTEKLFSPFYTTRTSRNVGLGLPLLKMLAEMTGGRVKINSVPEKACGKHGTTVIAEFGKKHLDSLPLGDITETVIAIIQNSPGVNFTFVHKNPCGEIRFSTKKIKTVLGDISISEPKILMWIEEYLREQYNAAG